MSVRSGPPSAPARWAWSNVKEPRHRQSRKASVINGNARLSREAYGGDFEKIYGPHGADFIKCHRAR